MGVVLSSNTCLGLVVLAMFAVGAHGSRGAWEQGIHYRTYFGQCPTGVVGKLALQLAGVFEQEQSLRAVKQKIVGDQLAEKYYLAAYNVEYNPLSKILQFSFHCPSPLMRVQIYQASGTGPYSAILVDNGQLLDPNYEVLLRSEKILRTALPSLALAKGLSLGNVPLGIAKLVQQMEGVLKKSLAEVIVSEQSDLTLIFSIKDRPSSVFLGEGHWGEKLQKLHKIMHYMTEKDKIPSIINLTDERKIVVKFSDKF